MPESQVGGAAGFKPAIRAGGKGRAMNKHETEQVDSAINDLCRMFAWIKSDRVELCSVNAPPGIAYTNKDGRTLQTLNKDIGSDLQIGEQAMKTLVRLVRTRGFAALKAESAQV